MHDATPGATPADAMAADDTHRDFPGARTPDRSWRLDANGVGIAVNEWGDADAPVLMCVHGGADFSRTFDVFAPLLAAGGWRVWEVGISYSGRTYAEGKKIGWKDGITAVYCILRYNLFR